MKLKLVVASMSVLGLISGAAFAADTTDTSTTTTTTTAQEQTTQQTAQQPVAHHHRHHGRHHGHHHGHHHHRRHHEETVVEPVAYKDTGAMYKDQVVVGVDNYQTIYDAMGQNLNRGRALPDWFNRIGFSGGINFDAFWGNRGMGYMGEDVRRIALNDAFLNTTAIVNDWARGFLSISYNNASDVLLGAPKAGRYSNVYSIDNLNLEQGYITIADYDYSPIFIQIGKQFQDFGRYTIHPLQRSMTQVMSESLHTSAKLGFITRMGFHGQIYAFDNGMTQFSQGHPKSVYGASLGYDQINDQFGFDIGVGYMSQLVGANDVQWAVGTFNLSILPLPGITGTGGAFVHTVGGISVYADLNTGPFTLGGRFVTAIQNYSPFDLTTQYHAAGAGAKPWTFDVIGGFGFNCWARNQNIYIGYERSKDAVNLYLPHQRYIAGWNIDILKNASLGFEYGHDQDYGAGANNGTSRSSNTFGVRGAVRFG